MDSQTVIDIGRQAIWNMLIIGAPVLLAGMAVGLLIGLLQALTQIQEQTVAFVPKIVAMLLAVVVFGPWMLARLVEFSQRMFVAIP